jgi:hypothetical protein
LIVYGHNMRNGTAFGKLKDSSRSPISTFIPSSSMHA